MSNEIKSVEYHTIVDPLNNMNKTAGINFPLDGLLHEAIVLHDFEHNEPLYEKSL